MTYSKEQLIQELGLEGFEPAKQEELLNMFYTSLNMKLRMAVAAEIPEDKIAELDAEIAKGDDAVYDWIDANVPQAAEVIEKETQTAVEDLKRRIAPFMPKGE